MPKYSEDTLDFWRKPPSPTEKTKLENAEKWVKEAINADAALSKMKLKVFGQGSYANDTNVRVDSDIDINVCYHRGFYYGLPKGRNKDDYRLNSPHHYQFPEFKTAIDKALKSYYGDDCVKRNDKCITIKASSNRIETDVVPTFLYKSYFFDVTKSPIEGARFQSDKEKWIVNFPEQHIQNGIAKNAETQKRFKRLTRIFRKTRYKMMDDGIEVSNNITSFLLECLVWNVPNPIFNENDTWTERFKRSIIHLYQNTDNPEKCKGWKEVSDLLPLFQERKWTSTDVNSYLVQMWNYLEYKT